METATVFCPSAMNGRGAHWLGALRTVVAASDMAVALAVVMGMALPAVASKLTLKSNTRVIRGTGT